MKIGSQMAHTNYCFLGRHRSHSGPLKYNFSFFWVLLADHTRLWILYISFFRHTWKDLFLFLVIPREYIYIQILNWFCLEIFFQLQFWHHLVFFLPRFPP